MPTIGRYQLLEKLGQGGMGVVYRAQDPLLQRIVAIKVISTPIEEDAERQERFFREARAAGQLSHKNIITIHDLGEHEGQPYLAMEYLNGQDLAAGTYTMWAKPGASAWQIIFNRAHPTFHTQHARVEDHREGNAAVPDRAGVGSRPRHRPAPVADLDGRHR